MHLGSWAVLQVHRDPSWREEDKLAGRRPQHFSPERGWRRREAQLEVIFSVVGSMNRGSGDELRCFGRRVRL